MSLDAERAAAEVELALVDADVARWYVNDGQLSEEPLGARLSEHGRELRERRLAAVEALERAGGRDPAPTLLLPPTEAQRAAHPTPPRVRAVLELEADREKLHAYHGRIADEIRADGETLDADDTPERLWRDRCAEVAGDEAQVAFFGWRDELDMSFRLTVEGEPVEVRDGEP